jgi:hypothetical protein
MISIHASERNWNADFESKLADPLGSRLIASVLQARVDLADLDKDSTAETPRDSRPHFRRQE